MNNPTPLRPRLDTLRNPLEDALANYNQIESDLRACQKRENDLSIENGALTAEVGMLRDALERADSDRIRLQSIASTFMGGIRSLNAVCGDLVKLAIKNGVAAAEEHAEAQTAELNKAGGEVREILNRVEPAAPRGLPLVNKYE